MQPNKSAFESAGQEQRASTLGEFVYFLKQNKKWWLIPILTVLLLFGILVVLSATGAGPFIYTLF